MPYELQLTKKIDYKSDDFYWNECCYGGEVIVDELMPLIKERFNDIQSDQEDWGWFIWFSDTENNNYAIDVFCDDIKTGEYRIHLTSTVKKKGLLWSSFKTIDNEEIKAIGLLIEKKLSTFSGQQITSLELDENHKPRV